MKLNSPLPNIIQAQPGDESKQKDKFHRGKSQDREIFNAAAITFPSVNQPTFQLFARAYCPRKIEPEIASMRHPLPLRERINWRLVALLIAIVALCLTGAIFGGGEARTVTELGPGWSCKPKIFGTVCVRDVATTTAKR